MHAEARRAPIAWHNRHTYATDQASGRIVIREPEIADAGVVCSLHGDPQHPATHLQAIAICNALDNLARHMEPQG